MEKVKKIKIYIGLLYLTTVGIFLYFLFSKFSLQELSSYEFIKDNIEYFSEIKTKNIFLLISFLKKIVKYLLLILLPLIIFLNSSLFERLTILIFI